MFRSVLAGAVTLLFGLPVGASEIVLQHTAMEKVLKQEVFVDQGRYHLIEPSACNYAYLEKPQVSLAAGRIRIKSLLSSRFGAGVAGQCAAVEDAFHVTVSGKPVFRSEKLAMDDIRLDDISDPAWRVPMEVFLRRAAPRVVQINLREALIRSLKDSGVPYEVTVEKLVVTKLVAEENKLRATLDFVLMAR